MWILIGLFVLATLVLAVMHWRTEAEFRAHYQRIGDDLAECMMDIFYALHPNWRQMRLVSCAALARRRWRVIGEWEVRLEVVEVVYDTSRITLELVCRKAAYLRNTRYPKGSFFIVPFYTVREKGEK